MRVGIRQQQAKGVKMVDQTLPEINAVHEKNKARRYYYRLEQDFKKWLKQCPVKYEKAIALGHPKTLAYQFNLKEKGNPDE